MELAHGLPIDLQVLLETRMLIQANAGGGKSRTLRRLIEQTASSVQQLIIDPEGEFATLREKHDFIICAPHDAVMSRLPGPERKLLAALIEAYPASLSNDDLASRAGYAPKGGAFNNPRGRLRSLGLIEYQAGMVRARSILFPEAPR